METNIQLIDTHAHIYDSDLLSRIGELKESWDKEGVSHVLMPNIDVDSISAMHVLSDAFPECLPMMGLHPCYVKDDYKKQLDEIKSHLGKRSYIAIGEMGIDLYWDKSFVDEQKESFLVQVNWALEHNLPIVIHSRESLDMTIDLVAKSQNGNLKGVFHCFNGNLDQAKKIIDLGFYMGIGGVVTYKNSGVGETVAQIPLEHLVLETDSPYLSPVPHRGKKNQPAYLNYICQKVADVKNEDYGVIANETTKNAKKLFGLAPKS